MTRHIDVIIEKIKFEHPEIDIKQLKVKHAADDNGLWFFKTEDVGYDVQIESSRGCCPFLIETGENVNRYTGLTISETIRIIYELLHII